MKYNSKGFTLFEIMVAMALLVFIVAMVFELLTSFLSTTDVLQLEQGRMDKVAALRSFFSIRLGTVPADVHFLSTDPDSKTGGILLGNETRYTAYDTVIQSNGLLELKMATYNPSKKDADSTIQTTSMLDNYRANKSSLTWTSLLKELKDLHWRFFDKNTAKWSDTWTVLDHNPQVVEATVQIAGEADPEIFDFPIIQLVPQPLFASVTFVNGPNNLTVPLQINGQPTPSPTPAPNSNPGH